MQHRWSQEYIKEGECPTALYIVSAASLRTLLALICEELLFSQINERRRGGGGGDKEREDKGTYEYSACTLCVYCGGSLWVIYCNTVNVEIFQWD